MTTEQTRFAAMARQHRKQERLGEDHNCRLCGEEDVRGLHRVELIDSTGIPITVTLCASCHVQLRGKQPTELHHPAGRANDPFTVPIPATEHAILSDWQHDWPRATWRNPDGSPLLIAAASLRGWLDILRLLLERTVSWIPGFLEQLDAVLRQQYGP
ncbi:MAG: hypothetical protein M3R02_24510 [Chloroflexota bacterium]|nr:hypothetical protein [Chloroflexota bacterium]